MSWIAEDVPWYMIDKSVDRPWRDEDVAMSAPRRLGKVDREDEARTLAVEDITECAHYNHVARAGETEMYLAQAEKIASGEADGVKIHGRYWRVREV